MEKIRNSSFLHTDRSVNGKRLYVEDWFCLLLLALITGCRTAGPDWEIYTGIYEKDLFTKDIGFGCFVWVLKHIGLDIYHVRMIITVIGLALIFLTARKFLNRGTRKLLYLLYFICPFFMDGIQLRNYLGMSVFIFAVPYLIESGKSAKIKYAALVLVAGLIHKVFFIYLLLLFVDLIEQHKWMKYTGIGILTAAIVLGLHKKWLAAIEALMLKMLSGVVPGIEIYLDHMTNWGWTIPWFVATMGILATYAVSRLMKQTGDERAQKLSRLVLMTNLIYVVIFPLYVLDVNFFRICRNLQVLNAIDFALFVQFTMQGKIQTTRIQKIIVFGLMAIQVAAIGYYVVLMEYWDSIFLSAFRDNWFFDGIAKLFG